MEKTDKSEGIKDLTPNDFNLNQFLLDAKYIFPKKDAMQYLKRGEYYGINWEETFEISRLFCLGLMTLGIEKGDKVGIFSHSRYEWRLCDYGVLLAAACSVTLYPSLTPAQIEYIINDSGIKIIFIENSRLLRRVLTIKDKCPTLTRIIIIAPIDDTIKSDTILSLDDLIQKGQAYYDNRVQVLKKSAIKDVKSYNQDEIRALLRKLHTLDKKIGKKYYEGKTKVAEDKLLKKLMKIHRTSVIDIAKSFDKVEIYLLLEKLHIIDIIIGTILDDPFVKRYHSIKPDDLASIVYTSGTTGLPKGALLTHKNFHTNVINTLKAVPIRSTDISLSFLPLSHVLERLTGHFLMTKLGATVAYAKNTDTILENLNQVRPTYMTAVPRIFEKVWDKLISKIEEEGGKKEEIFWKTVDWGHEYQQLKKEGEEIPFSLKLKNKLAHAAVFDKIKEKLGGRIRFMFSGGAALSVQIARFFQAADIKILEGYGLTETSPVLTVNTIGKVKIGTVGMPIPDTDIKIAPDGEIMAKGPQVFQGYINKPEETKNSFNEEGYFLTGDLGKIDEDGFLKITGRKKTLIVLRTGKKVSPIMVEEALKSSRFIEQACLLGDDQKFITSVIVPNFEFIGEWGKDEGLMKYEEDDLVVDNSTTREKYAEILENRKKIIEMKEVQAFLENIIVDSQKELSDFEKVKKFIVVPDDWNEYNELLTPSLKMKRPNIVKNYLSQIKGMYGEHWME